MTAADCETTLSTKQLLTIRDVAKQLTVSERTVLRWTAPRGALACVRIGHTLRFRQADVDTFVAGNVACKVEQK